MGTLAALLLVSVAAAQAPSASIAGRVTELATGRPVARARVAAVGSDRKRAGETLTDADGRYELSGLAPGTYAVSAGNDEHRSTYLRQWFGETGPSPMYGVPPRFAISLTAGERRGDVDMALTRALGIEGQVLDPWGEPMAAVEVRVSAASGATVSGGSAYTNDLGGYRVFGLMPGRYRVCVTPRGEFAAGEAASLGPTCYPSAAAVRDASDVTLGNADATGIDIRVQRSGTRTISGTVFDAAGAAVEGAGISAMPFDEGGISGHANSAGGAFTIKGLAAGRYLLTASIGGSSPADPNPPKREREMSSTIIDLNATESAVATLVLAKAITVPGIVTLEGSMPPAARRGLRLSVETRTPSDLMAGIWNEATTATVKEDLSFALNDLYRTPVYVVLRSLPDGWALKSVRYGERDITYTATDFGSAPAGRLEVTMTNRVATPSTKAVDERGEDVPAAQVIAIPASPDRWQWTFARVPTTPPNGPFSKLGAMLPGDYFFAALKLEDFGIVLRDPSRLPSIAAIGTRVTLAAGESPRLTLRIVALPDK